MLGGSGLSWNKEEEEEERYGWEGEGVVVSVVV